VAGDPEPLRRHQASELGGAGDAIWLAASRFLFGEW
jgi:hypothetical protein